MAVNEIGESEPSATVDVQLLDEEDDADISQISSASNDPLHIPRLSRPKKPTLTTDGMQTKAVLSWEAVDRAMIYGVERKRVGASANEFWLEVANADRPT